MPHNFQVTRRSGIDSLAEIVHHANSPACPSGMFELNPAFGCEFGCAYCGIYALEKEFFNEVIVYVDFPAYLDKWLTENRDSQPGRYFYFSAKTDALQPALVESGVTLSTLQVLRKHRARYFLVTKGGLPSPDICAELVCARDINQVIISATMPSEELRVLLEPAAGTMEERLALARFCVANAIFVTASCCPVLPIGDPTYLAATIARFAAAGVKHFYFDFARLSRDAVLNLMELLPEHKQAFERHYFTEQAHVTRWHMPHRNVSIDKFQPPLPFMLQVFQALADFVRQAVPGATVSVCNHFATPKTLPHFNDRARAECISCIGHRFSGAGL